MKKQNKNYIILKVTIILLIISLLNIRIETYEAMETKAIIIERFNEIKLQKGFKKIHCDKPYRGCWRGWDCPDDVSITYEWASNVVGDPKSDYLEFYGYGTCTIKYPKLKFRLTWF